MLLLTSCFSIIPMHKGCFDAVGGRHKNKGRSLLHPNKVEKSYAVHSGEFCKCEQMTEMYVPKGTTLAGLYSKTEGTFLLLCKVLSLFSTGFLKTIYILKTCLSNSPATFSTSGNPNQLNSAENHLKLASVTSLINCTVSALTLKCFKMVMIEYYGKTLTDE